MERTTGPMTTTPRMTPAAGTTGTPGNRRRTKRPTSPMTTTPRTTPTVVGATGTPREPEDDPEDKADGGNPPVSDWERDGERDAARPLPLKPILIAVGAAVLVTACVFGMLQYRRVEAYKAAVEAHTAACRTLESDSAEYRRLRRELADLKVKVDEPKTPDCSQSTTDAIRKADKRLGSRP